MRPIGAIWSDAVKGEFLGGETDERAAWLSKWCHTCTRSTDNQCPLYGVIAAGYTPVETTDIECSTYIPKETDESQDMPVLGNGEYAIVAPSHLPFAGNDTAFLPVVE